MEPKLGKLIEGEAERDAVHVAILPVVATEKLAPGQDVGLCPEGSGRVAVTDNPIGIIDPFLKNLVFPEQSCWLFLYPGTVTGMRHHWSHPEVDSEPVISKPTKEDSEAWLRDFAEKSGMSYDVLLERVGDFVEYGDVWVERDSEHARDAWYDLEDKHEFWQHFEAVTGKRRDTDEAPFSCSC